jgi:protein-tyrosine kinase
MSRIHDALKRAMLERSSAQAIEVVADAEGPQTVPENEQADTTPRPQPSAATREAWIPSPATGDYLRYENLLARCAPSPWTPNPNMNVFDPALGEGGAEQFRTLRTRLYQLRSNQPLRTLLITSSVAAEGKTFVASNIGQAIVRQKDRRVLIIDADLRCSRLHVPLGAKSSPGLTDYLRGDADEFATLQRGPEGNLWLLAGGNAVENPSELLSNGRLKALLDRVVPLFDWVIVDSPPCLPVADASVLADFCDGVLLVVKAGSTPTAVAQRARHELQGRNVVGVLLNSVREDDVAYGSYYIRGYYGRGEADSADKAQPAR